MSKQRNHQNAWLQHAWLLNVSFCLWIGMAMHTDAQAPPSTSPSNPNVAQGRVLATPFGGRRIPGPGAIAQQNVPSAIPYGGTLPNDGQAGPDDPASSDQPELLLPPETFEEDRVAPPLDSAKKDTFDPATDTSSLDAMLKSSTDLIVAIESIHDQVTDKSSWVRQAQRIRLALQAIEDHRSTDSPTTRLTDLVTDLSLESRSLYQAMSNRLSQGISSEHFRAVQDARGRLGSEIIQPLIPWERQAGLPSVDPGQPAASSLDSYQSQRPRLDAYPALPPSPALPPRAAFEFSWESRGYPGYSSYRFGWEEPALVVPVPAPVYGLPPNPLPYGGYGPYGAVIGPSPYGYPLRGGVHIELPFVPPMLGFGW